MDTLTPGRIDIVIFANGGYERIGYIAADPEIPETEWLPDVVKFVNMNQNLSEPKKFTGYYSIKDGQLKMSWREYAGEIPVPETSMDIEANAFEAMPEPIKEKYGDKFNIVPDANENDGQTLDADVVTPEKAQEDK